MTTHHPFLRLLDSQPIFSITFDVKAEQIPEVIEREKVEMSE